MGKLYSSSFFFARAYCLSLWYLVLFVQMVSLWYYCWTLAEKLGGFRQNKWDCKLLWIWTCLEVSRFLATLMVVQKWSFLPSWAKWAKVEHIARSPGWVLKKTWITAEKSMHWTCRQYCNGCRAKTGHPAMKTHGKETSFGCSSSHMFPRSI